MREEKQEKQEREAFPSWQWTGRREIDLEVVREHLTAIEDTLLTTYRIIERIPLTREHGQRITLALDRIQELKKAFGMTPIYEQASVQKSAVRSLLLPPSPPPPQDGEEKKKEEEHP
jgi:hypothetical protein